MDAKVYYVDYLDIDVLSVHELDAMIHELGCVKVETIYYNFHILEVDLDFALLPLGCDQDVLKLGKYVDHHNKEIYKYNEHSQTMVHMYFISPLI